MRKYPILAFTQIHIKKKIVAYYELQTLVMRTSDAEFQLVFDRLCSKLFKSFYS